MLVDYVNIIILMGCIDASMFVERYQEYSCMCLV